MEDFLLPDMEETKMNRTGSWPSGTQGQTGWTEGTRSPAVLNRTCGDGGG